MRGDVLQEAITALQNKLKERRDIITMDTIKAGNKKTADRMINIICKIIPCFAIAVCIYVFCFSNNEESQITSTGSLTSITEFTVNDEQVVSLPYSYSFTKNEKTVLSCRLPESIPENYSLTFRSLYCAHEVYVDDRLIGSYGTQLPLSFGHMTGNIRVIIPLEAWMAGKELKQVITPYYSISGDLSSIDIGYTDEIKRQILNDNMFRVVVCVILLTIMFTAIGILIYQLLIRSKKHAELLRSFIFFDLTVVIWIVCSSDIPQFFTNCNEGVSLVSFLALSIICIPFTNMCSCVMPRKEKIFTLAGKIGWIIPLMISFCFITNICDPMDMLTLTHIYILACIALSFFFSIKEWNNGASSKFMLVGMIEIALAAVIGMILWFIAPSKGYDATAFSIGFVLFISTLFALIGYQQIKLIEAKKYTDVYKYLAYTDSLTMVKNRTAFEQRFAQMQERDYKDVLVSLMMFDLNNLKITNDTLGHQEGDRLIVGTGNTLKKVFNDIGDVFRLGGDEFAVILTGYNDSLVELKTKFKKELHKYGTENNLKLSCAVGYAQLKWNPGDTFFRDIYKIADREMYKDKVNTRHGETECDE